MKMLLLLCAALLSWEDPNEAGSVGKFVVYHSTNVAGLFAPIGETAERQLVLPRLRSGSHFFYVTAVGTNGLESDPSNQVLAPVVNPPQGLLLKISVP